MLNAFVTVATPFLLVFGLYHLFTWFDLFHLNRRIYWKRVGLTAGISHVLLATGFFLFTYFDFESNQPTAAPGMSYGAFLFQHSAFWNLATVLDTLPMAVLLVVFTLMDRTGIAGPLLPLAMVVVYVVGTFQWYFVGGGVGLLLDRFWNGLKTGDDGEEWFQ
jgi:hypothetical protein